MSPPRLTSTPQPAAAAAAAAARSAAHAFAVAPRSSRAPAGTRTVALLGRARSSASRPARTVSPRVAPGSPCTPGSPRGGASTRQSRSYPPSSSARPTVGSTSPSVRRARRAPAQAPRISSGLTWTARPARAFSSESSESARKRLHARSIASSCELDLSARRAQALRGSRHAQHDACAERLPRARRRDALVAGSKIDHEPPETTGAAASSAGAASCAVSGSGVPSRSGAAVQPVSIREPAPIHWPLLLPVAIHAAPALAPVASILLWPAVAAAVGSAIVCASRSYDRRDGVESACVRALLRPLRARRFLPGKACAATSVENSR